MAFNLDHKVLRGNYFLTTPAVPLYIGVEAGRSQCLMTFCERSGHTVMPGLAWLTCL